MYIYICIYIYVYIYTYYIVCTNIQAKLSLIILIIQETSIYDEGVLSEGVLSGRSLCTDGVMYGGGFVQGGFVLGGFVRRGFCPEGVLSYLRSLQCRPSGSKMQTRSRHGVKYIEMYLNTNTFEGFKYKYF